VNRFLTVKEMLRGSGELAPPTFHSYYRTCQRITKVLGLTRVVQDLTTSDFESFRATALKDLAQISRNVEMQRVRMVFKFAYDEGLIEKPLRLGLAFKAPNAKSMHRKKAAAKEARILTAEQIRAAIETAGVYLRAMILLGINAGFGNHDCATLTFQDLDLEGGWHNHPRPKTGVPRRAKLWPETVRALKAAIAARRKPRSPAYANLVFLTQRGNPWVRWANAPAAREPKSLWRDSL
jgi:integrase